MSQSAVREGGLCPYLTGTRKLLFTYSVKFRHFINLIYQIGWFWLVLFKHLYDAEEFLLLSYIFLNK